MRNTDDNPKFDYNIYKINFDQRNVFKEYLEERGFEEIPLKSDSIINPCGFSFTLMFCDKAKPNGSAWINLLSSCSEWDISHSIRIYGAVLICSGESSCYAVSYGNAHFYLSNYCDYNFGIHIAERLVNLDSVKAQQNVLHGGKQSKTHVDYLSGSTLSYHGGEIPTYIKGESINEEMWGKFINCGTSAQFKWDETPLQIGRKLSLIDKLLEQKASETIPRLIKLNEENDSGKIDTLFLKLAEAIDCYDISSDHFTVVNVPSFYMVGTKIVQNDSVKFKLSCNRKHKEYTGELSIKAIKDFLQEKQLDIYNNIQNIKLSVEYGNESWTPYKPLVEYLEFITEDNFCLRNGKWCSFNNSYIEQIMRDVSKIEIVNHVNDGWEYNKEKLLEYAKGNNLYEDNDEKQPYETYYNNKLKELLNGRIIHPNTSKIDETANGKYRYEACDILKDSSLMFVKVGTPSNFAYAVDQAMVTMSKIENGYGKIKITIPDKNKSKKEEIEVEPSEFRLILVNEKRKKKIESWNDVFSVNFLIHLSKLKQGLNMLGISLKVDFVYDNIG